MCISYENARHNTQMKRGVTCAVILVSSCMAKDAQEETRTIRSQLVLLAPRYAPDVSTRRPISAKIWMRLACSTHSPCFLFIALHQNPFRFPDNRSRKCLDNSIDCNRDEIIVVVVFSQTRKMYRYLPVSSRRRVWDPLPVRCSTRRCIGHTLSVESGYARNPRRSV
jgi:hypothetical protein